MPLDFTLEKQNQKPSSIIIECCNGLEQVRVSISIYIAQTHMKCVYERVVRVRIQCARLFYLIFSYLLIYSYGLFSYLDFFKAIGKHRFSSCKFCFIYIPFGCCELCVPF